MKVPVKIDKEICDVIHSIYSECVMDPAEKTVKADRSR